MNDWTTSRSIERARDVPQDITTVPLPRINFTPQPEQPTVQFPQDRALPPWATEDRILYNRAKQKLAEQRALMARATSPFYNAVQVTEPFVRRQREQEEARKRELLQPFAPPGYERDSGVLGNVIDAARTRIPEQIREPLKNVVSETLQTAASGGPLGRAVSEVAERVPVLDRFEDVRQKIVNAVSDTAAEVLVPREVWEAALEFLPGVGTVPDVIRGVRAGSPDAVRALRQAMDSPTVRALQSERGALEPEVIPDNVRSLLSRRGKAAISEEEMQARWDSLPVSTQKLITSMADVVPLGSARRKIVSTGRARQIAKSQEAVEQTRGLPADERSRAIAKSLRGKIIPGVQPIRERFTQVEADEIFQRLDEAVDAGDVLGVEYGRAQSAMNLLFYGERIPGFDGPANLMPNEVKLLGKIYGPEFEAALPKTAEELSNWQKAVDVLSIPRAIQASIDFSAPGRQGLILGTRNPDYWFQAWKRQFQAAFGGDRGWEKVANEIRSDPHFESGVRHGLDFTDIGGGTTAEEAFVSHWVEKFPGVKQSGRAYTAFLDYLRLKSFGRGERRLTNAAQKYGWQPERLENALDEWAYFVNVASGRGDLGALNKFTPALNAAFFSPRFFVSRPQTIWQIVKPGGDIAVRQQVFETAGLYFGLGASLLATLRMTGAADVELDPRSTDFGKIRVGPQRIDFWGGLQPLARYMAQISTRTRIDPYARENVPAGAWDSVQRFIRSKLSPVGAVAWDFIISKGRTYEGKEIVGENPEISLPRYALDRLAPIGLQDIYEGYKTAGLAGAAGASLSLIGASTQTYDPTERQGAIQRLEEAGINVTYVDDRPNIRVPQLEKDWQSKKWHALFKEDFAELGDTTRFEYANDLREAYVDYWWKKKGDPKGVGESQRRRDLGEAFERHPSINKWRDNEQAERLAEWTRHPDLLLDAVRSGLETLNQDEEEVLEDAGLVPR